MLTQVCTNLNQICSNLISLVQQFFARWCGCILCIPSSYGTAEIKWPISLVKTEKC